VFERTCGNPDCRAEKCRRRHERNIDPLESVYEAQRVVGHPRAKLRPTERDERGNITREADPIPGVPYVIADKHNDGVYVSTRKSEFLSWQGEFERGTISTQEARRYAKTRGKPVSVSIDQILTAKFGLERYEDDQRILCGYDDLYSSGPRCTSPNWTRETALFEGILRRPWGKPEPRAKCRPDPVRAARKAPKPSEWRSVLRLAKSWSRGR